MTDKQRYEKIEYSLFYRRRGVRLMSQIAEPTMHPIETLDLPLASVLHYLDVQGQTTGPQSDDYLFRHLKKPIYVNHVTNLTSELGNPRKITIDPKQLQTSYHNQHRRMLLLRNYASAERARDQLVVINYAGLFKTARYQRSFYTEYFRWYNDFATALDEFSRLAAQSLRHHFICVKVPKLLPSVMQLQESEKEFTQRSLKYFKTEESFLLLELWKWLGEHPENSVFSRIPINLIHKLNLIYIEASAYTVVNLGQLFAFKGKTKEELKKLELAKLVTSGKLSAEQGQQQNEALVPMISVKKTLTPIQIQKRLLRMMMTIMETRTVGESNDADSIKPAVVSKVAQKLMSEDEPQSAEDTYAIDDQDLSSSTAQAALTTVQEPTHHEAEQDMQGSLEEELADNTGLSLTDDERIELEDKWLDEELATLNEIATRQEEQEQKEEISLSEIMSQDPDPDLSLGVVAAAERLADQGVLSAAEYKRLMRLSTAYLDIKAPFTEEPLHEFIKVTPEKLKISENISIPDSESIVDKSMLQSTLLDFDERYIKDIMQRDIAAMALSFQSGGNAVTDYQVETISDAMGSHNVIRINISPVVGKPSLLVAQIPEVKPNGTYVSNGTTYTLRKQRGDLPIRKVGPDRVALTSYYGKFFINRGRRRANDYGQWLRSQIIAKGLNKQDLSVQKLQAEDVFDNTFKLPRAYTGLSAGVRSFYSQGFKFMLARQEVLSAVDEKTLKAVETNGACIIAVRAAPAADVQATSVEPALDGARFILVDDNRMLYASDGKHARPINTIESFFDLPEAASPVESAGLVVFGKEIPIGVILAYFLGFEKLMRLLKVHPRRVPAKTRLNLQPDEYAIAFSDETLVFPRDNRLAAIVLSGFNEYKNSLKSFSVYSFEKRGVYQNLLIDNGLSVRYLREIEHAQKYFVDPITRGILVDMGEPTRFDGLLLSAAIKLLEDAHPDEGDPRFMREKGYERFAGALYTEITQALREHAGKLGRDRAAITLNPYNVARRISEDPAKNLLSEINPIEALKSMEAVTLGGTGGRSRRSMTKAMRAYHPNDMGVISEATVDSSDVSINIYTSANPKYINLRGQHGTFDVNNPEISSLYSTSALLAVSASRDD